MSLNRWDESTYYEILEIPPSASGREVHTAYLRAKDTYSPESPALYTMFTPEEARELLKMIDEAFNVLSNQGKRAEYDLSLARKGHPAFDGLLMSPQPLKVVSTPSPKANEEPIVVKTASKPTGREELPEGFARSRFGIYELNPLLEKEIASTEECDGAFLQKVRLYRKISLDQISEATRISKSYLAAVESNAYETLPAPVFVRGFVLQMVRIMGAPDRLADAYMKRMRRTLGK